MVHKIKTIYPYGLNKGISLKFDVGSQVPKEHLKKAEGSIGQNVVNKDEDIRTNTLNEEK